tara:strand:+ start:2702 stop:2944 length:243 start_codon:yes stop_codon:yes gene_type:complete
MSWKEQLHPKEIDLSPEERERLLQEHEEQFYNVRELYQSDCNVRECLAITCGYNRNYKCQLPEIDITSDSRCKQFYKVQK